MAGRPVQQKANIENIKKINEASKQVIDPRPIIVYTMRECGCTFAEIGKVFSISRQMAETIYKNTEKDL